MTGLSWVLSLFYSRISAVERLRWRIRHLLPSVGFIERSGNTRLARRFYDNLSTWLRTLHLFGLDPLEAHFGRSRLSLRRQAEHLALEAASQHA